MSILINGVEMPTNCEDCIFCDDDACLMHKPNEYRNWTEEYKNCPLIPVPPHGRLIDADAFSSEMKERQTAAIKWMRESVQDHDAFIRAEATVAFLSEVKLTLDKMPTIIPAEEGET